LSDPISRVTPPEIRSSICFRREWLADVLLTVTSGIAAVRPIEIVRTLSLSPRVDMNRDDDVSELAISTVEAEAGIGDCAQASRMGGRAVEGTGLENRQAGNRLVGSNPTPSAIIPTANMLIINRFQPTR
jgi:hypothetical protein